MIENTCKRKNVTVLVKRREKWRVFLVKTAKLALEIRYNH